MSGRICQWCGTFISRYETHTCEAAKQALLADVVRTKIEAAKKADPINHPPHYNASSIEPIDVIEAWKLSFCLGNVVKYIARAGKKDPAKLVEDLKKATWYLAREIEQLERGDGTDKPAKP